MHLRPPAFDHGVISFLWALFFFVLIWIGGQALGFGGAMTFIIGLVAGFGIFLFVRVYGEDEPPRPPEGGRGRTRACGPDRGRAAARADPAQASAPSGP